MTSVNLILEEILKFMPKIKAEINNICIEVTEGDLYDCNIRFMIKDEYDDDGNDLPVGYNGDKSQ